MKQQEEFLTQIITTMRTRANGESELIMETLAKGITEYRFTFAAWFSRYAELSEKDAEKLSDDANVRLLLRKLGNAEHDTPVMCYHRNQVILSSATR